MYDVPHLQGPHNKICGVDTVAADNIAAGIIYQDNAALSVPVPQLPCRQKAGAVPKTNKGRIEAPGILAELLDGPNGAEFHRTAADPAILVDPFADLFYLSCAAAAHSHTHPDTTSPGGLEVS